MTGTGPLQGKVAVVTGATRGCGRAIAVELGRGGATVFVAGRTTREHASPMGRPETIEGTAELVDEAGGRGIPVRCDFSNVADVDGLVARVDAEAGGRIDVLVDDVWGGDPYVDFDNAYWESPLDSALTLVRGGLETHLIALHRLLPLVVRDPGGLVVEVTDAEDDEYLGAGIPYYLVKCGVRAIGRALGAELTAHGCTGLSVTPGFLRSEAMLDLFGVTEENWRDAVTDERPEFAVSETPAYLARGVAALAADPDVARLAGRTLASWTLSSMYDITDVDGSRPDFGRCFREVFQAGLDPRTVDMSVYR
ncbi:MULTISPECIES: SDR family oxidoreductase [Prauserella salsuginis group]|uniref:NAD(P)-dependent dehydrogenase (Short-subunit alcohol dehydrogenase family) n=2 Tax=Prauserella salsuginis group TaxID=2893672 RepID=A0A839XSH4_9PSEU|nr:MULTISPECIES: SDR family oxidoreductase [Prauserella salsuginis group]MBB3662815.1 NAD(P)-dependent dehydrogenase (short-subunit alcohol dehydrogenase family) [Prauserella sediminis]MCR3720511.1 NAD(P)-dependent dehydrogenase, short-chain alcohol dehydrogenase family [Prauserella flava]MCR3733779.1 NAD(P)-dependent dehydrogenase, short-chain alcohol dehydrogenase family [Prauserella salsuginis]